MIEKQLRSIILDTSPILTSTPSISTLLIKAERIYTVPSVIEEVKDPNARSRLEVTVIPFLTIQSPKPESLAFVANFARRTGDYAILSRTDIEVLALSYELDCVQHGGDSRLRKSPGQSLPKRSPPSSKKEVGDAASPKTTIGPNEDKLHTIQPTPAANLELDSQDPQPSADVNQDGLSSDLKALNIAEDSHATLLAEGQDDSAAAVDSSEPHVEVEESESSGSEGWITPSNLKKQQAKDKNASTAPVQEGQMIQVATITGDFAMQVTLCQVGAVYLILLTSLQNVLLQIGLDLLTPSLQRIRNIRTSILRCEFGEHHA